MQLSRRRFFQGAALGASVPSAFLAGREWSEMLRLPGRGATYAALGYVDARQYGAVGDGAADETAAIQAAIDAAAAAGGGLVLLPAGTFIFSQGSVAGYGLVVKTGVRLRGLGEGVTVLKVKSGSVEWTAHIRFAPGVTDAAIESLTLDCNKSEQSGTSKGNGIAGSDRCERIKVHDVEIENCDRRSLVTNLDDTLSVTTDWAQDWDIRGVSVRNAGDKGIQVRRTRRVTVIGCNVYTNVTTSDSSSDSAFEASHAEYVQFVGSHAKHLAAAQGPSYRVVNNSKYVTVLGGTAEGGGQGLFVGDSSHVKFLGVTTKDTQDGCLIGASNVGGVPGWGIVDDVAVRDCTIINPDDDGVVVQLSYNGTSIKRVMIADTIIISTNASMSYGIRNAGDMTATGKTVEVREGGNNISGSTVSDLSGNFTHNSFQRTEYSLSGSIILADDTAHSVEVPEGTLEGIVDVLVKGASHFSAVVSYKAAATVRTTQLANGEPTRVDITTGRLTGTSGTDGNLTVSADDAGNIWLENRIGGTYTITYWFHNCV